MNLDRGTPYQFLSPETFNRGKLKNFIDYSDSLLSSEVGRYRSRVPDLAFTAFDVNQVSPSGEVLEFSINEFDCLRKYFIGQGWTNVYPNYQNDTDDKPIVGVRLVWGGVDL